MKWACNGNRMYKMFLSLSMKKTHPKSIVYTNANMYMVVVFW